MLLAELEIWHSRPIAPTRRVALGRRLLPTDPAPGFGGLLLGAVVAVHMDQLDPDFVPELTALLVDLEEGRRIPQPRLRHRFQVDHIGLAKSRHRLLGHGDELDFSLVTEGSPASQILGAAYAAGRLDAAARGPVMEVLRRAMRWRGDVGPSLVNHLSGATGARSRSVGAFAHPELWALSVLGFGDGTVPAKRDVQRRFRTLVRDAHPDHGALETGAAQRIADLSEARDILLA
ncbi:MAG TPA: hypothetical protein VFU93_02880 [Acidimicrobiales bacterium]|nr:hypothetical protein [Acidimicrobiales bacterium]